MGPCGMHDGRSTGATAINEDPVRGMTVCPIAVILGTSFTPWARLPGSFEIGCGVTVLGGEAAIHKYAGRAAAY